MNSPPSCQQPWKMRQPEWVCRDCWRVFRNKENFKNHTSSSSIYQRHLPYTCDRAYIANQVDQKRRIFLLVDLILESRAPNGTYICEAARSQLIQRHKNSLQAGQPLENYTRWAIQENYPSFMNYANAHPYIQQKFKELSPIKIPSHMEWTNQQYKGFKDAIRQLHSITPMTANGAIWSQRDRSCLTKYMQEKLQTLEGDAEQTEEEEIFTTPQQIPATPYYTPVTTSPLPWQSPSPLSILPSKGSIQWIKKDPRTHYTYNDLNFLLHTPSPNN